MNITEIYKSHVVLGVPSREAGVCQQYWKTHLCEAGPGGTPALARGRGGEDVQR